MSTIDQQGTKDRMTTTTGYDFTKPVPEPVDVGAGWISFAAIMLALAGVFGFIDGLVAVSKSSFYVAGAHFVFSDLYTWGWIVMIAGGLTLLAAVGVTTGSQLARWYGIFVAGLQAMAQLLMIQAYPFWSLCVFTIDLLVIFALATYGGRMQKQL